ncbi:MAG TPA: hypothetical protein VIT41_05415 [Microlunatus sp.]
MRASAVPSLSDPAVAARTSRLSRPVVWLLWLLAALAGSVVLGFLAGLARPREPDPWASVPPPVPPAGPPPPTDDRPEPATTTPSAPIPPTAEDD